MSVFTAEYGIKFLQYHQKTASRNITLMANGVMNVIAANLFHITLSNFSARTVKLPKHALVRIALFAPRAIFIINEFLETACNEDGTTERLSSDQEIQ